MKAIKKKCAQCGVPQLAKAFIGARGAPVRMCKGCRVRYRGWEKKTLAEKLTARAGALSNEGAFLVTFVPKSGNVKTGPIPVSITGRGSCPPACALYGAGCYASYGKLAYHWRNVPDRGIGWDEFCDRVAELPAGQLWRHNEAGDLPGEGNTISVAAVRQLARANSFAQARGFTFTHKPVIGDNALAKSNAHAVLRANEDGFTVNLSADTLEHADELARMKIAPVVVVLREDAPRRSYTPEGRLVIVCPAQAQPGMTCERCKLCAIPWRKAIIGFRAHGQFKKHVPDLLQLRRKPVSKPAERMAVAP